MKSVTKNQEVEQKSEYPCLKEYQSSDNDAFFIVLFESLRSRTVIYCRDNTYSVGHYCQYWNDDYFKPFAGTIELSN